MTAGDWMKGLTIGAAFLIFGPALVPETMAQSSEEPWGASANPTPASTEQVEEEELGAGTEATQDAEPEATQDAARRSEEPATAEAPNFNRDLLTVEEKTNASKEEVFRAKAVLQLLREIVIQGSTTGARAVIWHANDLGPSYSIVSATYFLDGQAIYTASEEKLKSRKDIQLWDGAISPGKHNIQVRMDLRGNGFGLFPYANDVSIRVTSNYAFTTEEGEISNLRVEVDERKGLWTPFHERPLIEYELETVQLVSKTE